MMTGMVLVAFLLALLLVVGVAAAVLVYVAYPHRGRQPRRARWAANLVDRISQPVQVHDDVHTQAMFADPVSDVQMAERMRRVERVVTAGISGRPAA
jgi:tetrahydromethanopterin S-methyltransferase subunit E